MSNNGQTLTDQFWRLLKLEIREIAIENANENHGSQEADDDSRQHVIREAAEVNALPERQQMK